MQRIIDGIGAKNTDTVQWGTFSHTSYTIKQLKQEQYRAV